MDQHILHRLRLDLGQDLIFGSERMTTEYPSAARLLTARRLDALNRGYWSLAALSSCSIQLAS